MREGRREREREEGDIRREQRTESANAQMVETPHDKPQLCPAFWGPIKLMDLGWNQFKSALEARWEAYVTFALASSSESKDACFCLQGKKVLVHLPSTSSGPWLLGWPPMALQMSSRNGVLHSGP